MKSIAKTYRFATPTLKQNKKTHSEVELMSMHFYGQKREK